jgi:fumarylacetoacetase
MKSWIDIPLDSDFSLANIPFGICSFPSSSNNNNNHATFSFATLAPSTPRCCTAIGNYAVDLHLLAEAGLLDNLIITAATDNDASSCVEITNFHPRIVFSQPTLNELMSCEKCIWVAVRNRLISLFLDSTGSNERCDYVIDHVIPHYDKKDVLGLYTILIQIVRVLKWNNQVDKARNV